MKIIIIDDNDFSLDMLRTVLEMANYDVTAFANPFDALKDLENNKYDVCIIDYMMPKMNGIEFINNAKDFLENTKIAFLTAINLDSESPEFNTISSKVDKLLRKPLKIKTLLMYLKSLN